MFKVGVVWEIWGKHKSGARFSGTFNNFTNSISLLLIITLEYSHFKVTNKYLVNYLISADC